MGSAKNTVEGLKDKQKVTDKELTFKVTAKDVKGKSLTPTVKFNGKEITGTNGKYEVTLVDGENTIIIIAIDADGNRADATYTIIYNSSGSPVSGGSSNPSNQAVENKNQNNQGDNKEIVIKTDSGLNIIYSDASSISSWALEAVIRATEKGFVTGYNEYLIKG